MLSELSVNSTRIRKTDNVVCRGRFALKKLLFGYEYRSEVNIRMSNYIKTYYISVDRVKQYSLSKQHTHIQTRGLLILRKEHQTIVPVADFFGIMIEILGCLGVGSSSPFNLMSLVEAGMRLSRCCCCRSCLDCRRLSKLLTIII